ncbi:MAG: DMT family transporter [Planctomycetales bacterium]
MPYVWMLTGAVAFSGMAAFTHSLKADIDWPVIALIRSLFACVLSFALAKLAGAKLVIWSSPVLWVRSLAGSLSVLGTFYALTHLPIADVLTLTNLFPIWVAILSWPLLRERPGSRPGVRWSAGSRGVLHSAAASRGREHRRPGRPLRLSHDGGRDARPESTAEH